MNIVDFHGNTILTEEEQKSITADAIRKVIENRNESLGEDNPNFKSEDDIQYAIEHKGYYLNELASKIAYDIGYQGHYDLESLIAAVMGIEQAMHDKLYPKK